MWAPGDRFGKYKLVERLGKGGMAETWRGELIAAEGVSKPVVIKRVLPSYADNKEFIAAFVQEARVTASLSHGNIAQVFDFGQVGDSHFIAMELIEGRSLDRVLKAGFPKGYWHLPFPIATLVTLEVAKGLEHVHTRSGPKGPLNIVHRDISPDNIIVGVNGETKLVDFGVAKSLVAGTQETEAGVIKGKYIYFSPEQSRGEKVDFRTDIYALGVVLYRLVTGKKAFDGPGLKVLPAIQRGERTPVRVANAQVPEDLALIIDTMMAVNKNERFESTLELVEALTASLQKMAPRAGVHWIRDYIRWLYEAELKKRGLDTELRAGFLELVESWRPGPKPFPTSEMVSAESRAAEMTSNASPHAQRNARQKASGMPKWLPAAVAGGGVMLLIVGVLAVVSSGSEPVRKDDASRLLGPRPATAQLIEPKKAPDSVVPSDDEPSTGDEPAEVAAKPAAPPAPAEPPTERPAPTEPGVAYDAEAPPVRFVLAKQHTVLLDGTPTMPAPSGTLSGARPLNSGVATAGTMAWTFGQPPNWTGGTMHEVPALLFTPGRPPTLEVLTSTGKWSHKDARLAMLVGSAAEMPGELMRVTANGEQVLTRSSVLIVDSNDRFTILDLSASPSWKLTVAAKAKPGESVPPALMYVRGDNPRLDGKPTVGGYVVVTPGTHRLNSATSAWFTVPTLNALKLATLEIVVTK